MEKEELIEELKVIVAEDTRLDVDSFFGRIMSSIKHNGSKRTASDDIYSLPLAFVEKVEEYMVKNKEETPISPLG